MQNASPLVPLHFPATQGMHVAIDVAAIALLYFPATQGVHVEIDVAADAALYVPAIQEVHDDAPLALQVPSRQFFIAEPLVHA